MLNKINNRTLRGAFGDDTAGWAGKIIAMFPTMADNRGKMVPRCGCAFRRRSSPRQQLHHHNSRRRQAPAAAQCRGCAAAPAKAAPPADPELEPDPVKPIREELDDEIPW